MAEDCQTLEKLVVSPGAKACPGACGTRARCLLGVTAHLDSRRHVVTTIRHQSALSSSFFSKTAIARKADDNSTLQPALNSPWRRQTRPTRLLDSYDLADACPFLPLYVK